MANSEHLDILKKGVEVWNKWRKENENIEPDLYRAELLGEDLRNVNFSKANLRDAFLHGANLYMADLRGCNLYQANLYGANLSKAKLNYVNLNWGNLWLANCYDANFFQADLFRASLYKTNFTKANLQKANLSMSDLINANLTDTDLRGAKLSGANLSKAELIRTDLTNCYIHGLSAWDVHLEDAVQSNLIITDEGEPILSMDNLELAQFIYLLLDHKKIRDVFNSVTEKGVLLLGRFSNGGLELLQAIAAKLREMQYLPMIFDFDRPDNRNYTETVKTLVGLSRFVIVDLSGPSVPQELYSTVPHYKIPFIPIIEEKRKSYAMFADLLEYPWVLAPVRFEDTEQLLELLLDKVIISAEEKFKERQMLLQQLFGN